MKAGQRHQLQTNYLADQMGKLWQGSKSSSGMLWGVLLLVVALGIAYWWWTANSANRISIDWQTWWNDRSSPLAIQFMPDDELAKIADHYRSTAADHAAQLTLADQLYEKGYQTTFSESALAAAKHFEKASAIYEALAPVASTQEVALRALVGAARCQESLGEVDQARAFYQKVVDRYAAELKGPNGVVHPLVADAQQRVAALGTKGDGLAFYRDVEGVKPWPLRLPKTSKTNLPPFGEMPPPPPDIGTDTPPPPPTFPETAPTPTPEGPPPPPVPPK